MKPSTEVRVSELKNEHNGRNRTYDMRSEDRSATCCHHRNFHLCPKIQHFSESPNKKRKKSLIDAKNMGNYTKRPKMHHKEGKSNVPTDKNKITQHFRHQKQIILPIHFHPYTPV